MRCVFVGPTAQKIQANVISKDSQHRCKCIVAKSKKLVVDAEKSDLLIEARRIS